MITVNATDLSKEYRHYRKPTDLIKEMLFRKQYHDAFYALKNIDFKLEAGVTLGVIGDNGAGKSTLLKLLAGTVKPSSGKLIVKGRVSAILELGSGFHPEFSGIENIRIGCSVLGLSKEEINRKLPEIIEFSELGEFIQRPVKNYSSGMYVRLAFSVVTSVNPDVLVIDEALSVGDQHFQRKSLDRIRGFITSGKTVVFCSHNLYQIKSLCNKVLWLDKGRLKMLGDPGEVVDAYLDHCRDRDAETRVEQEMHPQTVVETEQKAEIRSFDLLGCDGRMECKTGDDLEIAVAGKVFGIDGNDLALAVVITRNDNIHVYGTSTEIDKVPIHIDEKGLFSVRFILPEIKLLSGKYSLHLYLLDGGGIHIYDKREDVLDFSVRHDTREVGVSQLAYRWETGAR